MRGAHDDTVSGQKAHEAGPGDAGTSDEREAMGLAGSFPKDCTVSDSARSRAYCTGGRQTLVNCVQLCPYDFGRETVSRVLGNL